MGWHVTRIGSKRNAYRVSMGKPEGKRPQGRVRRRWEENIEMVLRENRMGDMDWLTLPYYSVESVT
jgi:hypothetical protein